jgi:hypothetical protein
MQRLLPLLLCAACTGDDGLKIINNPPEISFLQPVANTVIASGDPVVIRARVADPESALTDLLMTWSLEGVGEMGGVQARETENEVSYTLDQGLPVGELVVRLSAVDPQGLEGTAELPLTVRVNELPQITLTAPEDGSRYAALAPVTIEAFFQDADEDFVENLTLEWSGAAEGLTDAPAHPTSSGNVVWHIEGLDEGSYELSVRATDSLGGSTVASAGFIMGIDDIDGDGYGDASQGGTDCNDDDAAINPGAEEICDGVDTDCDGDTPTDETTDADADGFPECNDCDDDNDQVNPDGVEVCDAADNDCNGVVDDGAVCPCDMVYYKDHAYMLCSSTTRIWSKARERCIAYGYDLATVDDVLEDDWLDGEIDSRSTDIWLFGLNDITTEGTFVWADGSASTYRNWDTYEPNNYVPPQDCGALNVPSNGAWHDHYCDQAENYICETSD